MKDTLTQAEHTVEFTDPIPSVSHTDMQLRVDELNKQEQQCLDNIATYHKQIGELEQYASDTQKVIYAIQGARTVLLEWLNPQN